MYIHTDAFDYDIGAYLFQFDYVNNKRYPIPFVSKSPSKTERDWSTMDKKAFATCFALMKLEYLLRDIHFVLRTDHAYLTYINLDYKGRVKR